MVVSFGQVESIGHSLMIVMILFNISMLAAQFLLLSGYVIPYLVLLFVWWMPQGP